MQHKQAVALVGLLAVILVLTGFTSGAGPSSAVLGHLAPIIIPALLTLYLILMLVKSKTIIEILATFLVSRPHGQRQEKNLLATIVAYAIVILLGFAFIRLGFLQSLVNMLQQGAGFFSTIGNRTFALTQMKVVTSPSGETILLFYYSLAAFVAIFVVSVALLMMSYHKAFTFVREGLSTEEREKLREETLQVVRAAVTDLKEDGRFQETILKCYKKMCGILSEKGYAIGLSQTAREFAKSVSGKLRLGDDSVKALTLLFEEARYSNHQINDEKRKLALSELESLQQALAMNVGEKL